VSDEGFDSPNANPSDNQFQGGLIMFDENDGGAFDHLDDWTGKTLSDEHEDLENLEEMRPTGECWNMESNGGPCGECPACDPDRFASVEIVPISGNPPYTCSNCGVVSMYAEECDLCDFFHSL
jgi:hypothetical protein